ncbi:MAG: polysaccharide deacetylase family protein [Solirubrobacteraceae bacterium]|nr:polysaccharide deacetylase family protein [Solirubrobacteraceae bacterium]
MAVLAAAIVAVVLVARGGDGGGPSATLGAAGDGAALRGPAASADAPGATTTGRSTPTPPAGRGDALPATARNGLACRAPADGAVLVRNGARTGARRVALTFDDGPTIHTGPTLDALRRAKVRATFFVLGRQIKPNRALVRRIVTDGHALGSHTWSHEDVSRGDAVVDQQMNDTQYAIQLAVGRAGCLMRPPGGAVGPGLERWLARHRKLGVLWDVDSGDFRGRSTDAMVRDIVDGSRTGSIILMHDGGGDRRATVAAIPGIVRGLRARGFTFVTVPELLGLDGARPG